MTSLSSVLPLLVVALPLAGSALIAWFARIRENLRCPAANLVALGTLLLAVRQFCLVQSGDILSYTLPWSLGFGLRWRVDFISAVFAVAVSLVWLLATFFAEEYMRGEKHQTRFFVSSIFTLGSTLGVFLAGDLFTLFLFFEMMTFAAYLLVIHEESREAVQAGSVYLYLSVIGGLFLLGAIFFLHHHLGHTEFLPSLDRIINKGVNPWWLFLVLILGFGVKAGMLPLHIWLPKAHPVAPAPASALLSALMIKTGAYGFLRFLFVIFTAPSAAGVFPIQEQFGYVFIWIGAVTMLGGALMALIHAPMKRILAYSSISQMGYILFSLGTGVMLGRRGAFGFAGAWMHMINHAFFKSFLFLLAGAVYLQTRELNLDKLGGLKKQMPLTFAFFLIAAASITGVPGFNGYVSKVLIHEGILEAYHFKGWPALLWLERIFVFTGGLTAAYISKIWLKTFLARPKRKWAQVKDLSREFTIVFMIYTAVVLALGLYAHKGVKQLVLPAARLFPFLKSDLTHLESVPFWSPEELKGPLISYLIAGGALAFSALLEPKISIPRWWSVEILFYRPLYNLARAFFRVLGSLGAKAENWRLPRWSPRFRIDWQKHFRFWRKIRLIRPRFKWKRRRGGAGFVRLRADLGSWRLFFRKSKTSVGLKAAEVWREAGKKTDLIFDTIIIAIIFILALVLFLAR
mgnify:CR=1 FL=1